MTTLRRALAEWDATPRDVALALLAAPIVLVGLWAGLVLLLVMA